MQVVAAGVHVVVCGGERATRLLAQRQGVHVRAQQYRHRALAALAAAQYRHDGTQIVAAVNLQRQVFQGFEHLLLRARQVQANFGVLVHIAPELLQLREQFPAFLQEHLAGKPVSQLGRNHGKRGQLLAVARCHLHGVILSQSGFPELTGGCINVLGHEGPFRAGGQLPDVHARLLLPIIKP